METPLVPDAMSGQKKIFVQLIIGLSMIFMLVVFIVSLVYGTGDYHGGFVGLAIGLISLAICTATLLNWIRKDDGSMPDKFKYLAAAQIIVLLILCISMLVLQTNTEPAKVCPPEKCQLPTIAFTDALTAPVTRPALGSLSDPPIYCYGKYPQCFGATGNNFTVCIQRWPPNPK